MELLSLPTLCVSIEVLFDKNVDVVNVCIKFIVTYSVIRA